MGCLFCSIAAKDLPAFIVDEDDQSIAFLDHRPLFAGHVLVIPKAHHETLTDLPADLTSVLFDRVRRITRAVQTAMNADGSFVAVNNRVSQSVPHLHVHVVPRKRKDGLKGFFWPRHKYPSDADAIAVAQSIRAALP